MMLPWMALLPWLGALLVACVPGKEANMKMRLLDA